MRVTTHLFPTPKTEQLEQSKDWKVVASYDKDKGELGGVGRAGCYGAKSNKEVLERELVLCKSPFHPLASQHLRLR